MKKTQLIEVVSTIEQLEKELKEIEFTIKPEEIDFYLETLKENNSEEILKELPNLKAYIEYYGNIDTVLQLAQTLNDEIASCTKDDLYKLYVNLKLAIIKISEIQINIEQTDKLIEEKIKENKKNQKRQSIVDRLNDTIIPISYLNCIIVPLVGFVFLPSTLVFLITYIAILIGVPALMLQTINILSTKNGIKLEDDIKFNQKMIILTKHIRGIFDVERLFNSYLFNQETEKIEIIKMSLQSEEKRSVDILSEERYNEQQVEQPGKSKGSLSEKIKKRIRKKNK